MTRIRLADKQEMPPDIAEMCEQVAQLTGDATALRALAHRPDILRPFASFYWQLQTEGRLSRKMVELIRLSVAQINQCKSCLGGRYQDAYDQGLTEAMVEALPEAESSELFTEAEKAAIAYAQKMATNHFDIGDTDFARLYRHFSEEEVVEICMDVAQFIGVGRMFAVIDATNTTCAVSPEQVRAA